MGIGQISDLNYDPDERRNTPLALKLQERIGREGPITVAEYMQACLHDPEHGYYRTRTAIGAAGDFITAPEISQAFGELIGLWCAVVWQQMGAPARFNLVELGPGRGTLLSDALRAARRVPGFVEAARIVLVECNAPLRDVQRNALADYGPILSWHADLSNVPEGDAIVIANEFADTLPVRQRSGGGERSVALDAGGRLAFVPGGADTVNEEQDFSFVAEFGSLGGDRFAGLFIDYGHTEPLQGDTLQAVRAHRAEHPLTSPGEADLTVQVDFARLADAFQQSGIVCAGPITQAEFLGRLGIVERASRLMAANPDKATEIEAGVARLMAPNGMGTRFKVLGVRSPGMPPLPGF